MLERLLVGVEVLDRVCVELAPVLPDRLADLSWVGGEQERGEVEDVRREGEELADAQLSTSATGAGSSGEQPAAPTSALPARAAPSPRNSRLPKRPS